MGEIKIIKVCQSQVFSDGHMGLQKGDKLKKSSHIVKWNPVVQDGISKVGGRLHQSMSWTDVKHPVVLPKNHHISTLIFWHIHQGTGHSGRKYSRSKLRERFWIPQADSAIRKILSKSVTCKKVSGKPGEQKMKNLPQHPLKPDKTPLTYRLGTDYVRPFEVKRGQSRSRAVVYCSRLIVRAIHIDVAHSLSIDSCINAFFKRSISRRGQVSVVRSDNGTNLVGAEKEMCKAAKDWNPSKISATLLQRGITWIYNPPAGSHFGGISERQIYSLRKILTQVLKQQPLHDERCDFFL